MGLRHLYMRDYSTANKRMVGCLAVAMENNEVRYAFSVCSPLDVFQKDLAKRIAFSKLKNVPVIMQGAAPKTTHEITKWIMEHIVANNENQAKGQKRSVIGCKAAKDWLAYTAQQVHHSDEQRLSGN
jgi:hypothetical protein